MPPWLIIAAVLTIAVTALLTWVLYRINLSADRRPEEDANDGGA